MNVDQVSGVHWLVQAAVMEGAFANGSAFGGTPAEEIYRRWWEGNDMQTYANTYGHDIDMISEGFLPPSLNLSPANWLLPVRPDVANQVNIYK